MVRPTEQFFELNPREATLVARQVARRQGYIDWPVLHQWLGAYQARQAEAEAEQLSLTNYWWEK